MVSRDTSDGVQPRDEARQWPDVDSAEAADVGTEVPLTGTPVGADADVSAAGD